jgi:2-polyprenyl-3-methyl-5-hydroxy-6-metoxy-1,4-benzoquinol methylase
VYGNSTQAELTELERHWAEILHAQRKNKYQAFDLAGREFEGKIYSETGGVERFVKLREHLSRLGLDRIAWEGKTVVDMGTNLGAFAIETARRGAARVTGEDMDAAVIAEARIHLAVAAIADESLALRVGFRAVDSMAANERCDVALFIGVLHHQKNQSRALAHIAERTGDTLVFEAQVASAGVSGVALDQTLDCELSTEHSSGYFGRGAFPTEALLLTTLREVGFAETEVIGPGRTPSRIVVHARKGTLRGGQKR